MIRRRLQQHDVERGLLQRGLRHGLRCRRRGTNLTVSGGTWSYTSGNIGIGVYYATAVRTDTAGNTATAANFGPFTR